MTTPFRFETGDLAYVRGWPVDESARVISGFFPQGRPFPHYLVADGVGIEWIVPQIHMSDRPLPAEVAG